MTLPLDGIQVIDLTIWQQGPMATAMLADFGADVIKVEGPDSPDPGRGMVRYEVTEGGPNPYFETHNRNKRGLVLDLKNDQGLATFLRLAKQADVLVQNLRPGVSKRLGIDYATLSQHNPRLIYATATGFGTEGPDHELPALDPLAQARGGLMSVTGEPEAPPTRTFNGFADQISAFLLSFAIMMALWERERSGKGQEVDSSLLGATMGVQSFNLTSFLMSGTYGGSPIPRLSRRLTSPIWNTYKGKDGRWIVLAMAQPDRFWTPFRESMKEATGELVGPEELTVGWMKSHFGDLMKLINKLDELFATKPAEEWLNRFRAQGFLAELVQDYQQLAKDKQALANEMIVTFDHPSHGPQRMVNTPVNLRRTPGSIRVPAPEFGQHTEEVLLDYGFSWEELELLRKAEAIGPRASQDSSPPDLSE